MRRGRLLIEAEDSHINLMPLLDILFVLLVSYILAAPFIMTERVELAQGIVSAGKGAATRAPIRLAILAGGAFLLEGKELKVDELEKALSALHEAMPQRPLLLAVDKNATFEEYQKMKGAIARSGFDAMDLLVKQSA